jgi:hypothetical protein
MAIMLVAGRVTHPCPRLRPPTLGHDAVAGPRAFSLLRGKGGGCRLSLAG